MLGLMSILMAPSAQAVDLTLPAEILSSKTADFEVTAGTASGNMVLFVSATGEGAGPCPAPLGGTCMDILNPKNVGSATADANGDATISWAPPAPAAGIELSFQVVDQAALAVSAVQTQTIVQGVFEYGVAEGPFWPTNPDVYSCLETCAMLFGGAEADWECSTSLNSVDNMARAAEFAGIGCAIVPEDFKEEDPASPGYDCGITSPPCSTSAYVEDGCGLFLSFDTNYCHPQ